MKIKEKLAEEYAKNRWPLQDEESWDTVIQKEVDLAFIVGFDKAIKLAIEKVLSEYSYERDSGGSTVTEGRDIDLALLQLGEEEA